MYECTHTSQPSNISNRYMSEECPLRTSLPRVSLSTRRVTTRRMGNLQPMVDCACCMIRMTCVTCTRLFLQHARDFVRYIRAVSHHSGGLNESVPPNYRDLLLPRPEQRLLTSFPWEDSLLYTPIRHDTCCSYCAPSPDYRGTGK